MDLTTPGASQTEPESPSEAEAPAPPREPGLAAVVEGSLATLIEELPLGVVTLDADGVPRSINPQASQLLASPVGTEIREALHDAAVRARELGGLVELVLNLGWAGEVRILLTPMDACQRFLATIEQSPTTRLRSEIRVLRDMLAVVARGGPRAAVYPRALRVLAEALPGSRLTVWELDESRSRLQVLARGGAPDPLPQESTLPLEPFAGAPARAVRLGVPVFVGRLARSPFARDRARKDAERLASLALPVRRGEVIAGALEVVGPATLLTEGELRLLQGLADALGSLFDREQAEHARDAERAARLRLLDALPDAVLETNAMAQIELAGGATPLLFGRPPAACMHQPLESLFVTATADELRLALRAATNGSRATLVGVTQRADASTTPCEILVQGEPAGAARLVVRDVSEKARLERDVEVARRAAESRERLASIGMLAAGIAHEVNNPLAFVLANLHALGEDLAVWQEGGSAPDAELREATQMVKECIEGADRIANIVRALKGMARENRDKPSPFDPAQSIQDAVTIFRGAKRFACTLEVDLEPALFRVVGSPPGLGQVLINLLDNAVDAMDGQGSLRVRAFNQGNFVRIEVADSGPGIPNEIGAKVFEPFFTTKEFGRGTGLGLHICREIVQQMQGTLVFVSAPTGTTFTIDLPALV